MSLKESLKWQSNLRRCRIRKMPHHLRNIRGIYQVQLSVPSHLRGVVARLTEHDKPTLACDDASSRGLLPRRGWCEGKKKTG
jgi:hypothetical protein